MLRTDLTLTSEQEQEASHFAHSGTKPSVWSPGYLSLLSCIGLSVVLVIYYLVYIKAFVTLPADILMWAETNFVGDIIKLRTGAPIYTPPADNNSLIYTPGAPLLTYAISWLIGKPASIAAWRAIQIGFIFCAALIATSCSRRLGDLAFPDVKIPFPRTWIAFSFMALFLASTAPNTNKFAHCLHTDALALMVSMFSFWTMLLYLKAPSARRALLMAVCPAIGYFVKEFLLGWAVVMFVFLLLEALIAVLAARTGQSGLGKKQPRIFTDATDYQGQSAWIRRIRENPRLLLSQPLPLRFKRLLFFTATASLFILVVMGVCYSLWGDNYIFWTFKVMSGARKEIGVSPAACNISLARSLDHLIRAWMEIAIGVVGAALVLRGNNIRRLGPLWVSWVVLIALETFSSGAGWGVLYHFGPGVVIGMVWTLAALSGLWPWTTEPNKYEFPRLANLARSVAAAVFVMTSYVALHVVPTAAPNEGRNWNLRPAPDLYGYIAEIEREFEGLPTEKVLLDIGNWVYLRHSVLAKDRGVSLADQPCNDMYDNFDVMIGRIRNKAYDKILVHDLHSPFFIYDYALWRRPSGVRKALLENYSEARVISSVSGKSISLPMIMFTGSVSVLVPKSEAASDENNTAGEKKY